MKRHLWRRLAAAALLFLGGITAARATNPGDIIKPGNAPTPETQRQAAQAMAASGVSPDEADTAMTGSSGYTYLPAAAQAMATETATGQNLRRLMNSDDPGAVAGHRIANGTTALATANAATATVRNIAGTGGVLQTRIRSGMAQRRILRDAFGSDSALAAQRLNEYYSNRFWAAGLYNYQGLDKKDGYAAYDYRAWGGSVGYDRALGAFTLGAAFTYSRGEYDEDGLHDDNTIDNYAASLYASYFNCEYGFSASLYGGWNYAKNDMAQYDAVNAGWQRGRNHTNSYWVGGDIGYDINLGESFTLTPSAGLLWLRAVGSEYRSHGVYDMTVEKIRSRGLLLPVQLEAAYRVHNDACCSLTLKAAGGWAYDFKNDGGKGHMRYNHSEATPVLIQGVKPGRNNFNIGGGVTYNKRNFDIAVDYRYDWKTKYDAHRVSVTVGLRF